MLKKNRLVIFSRVSSILIIFLFGMMFSTIMVLAHPPASMELAYDFSNQQLDVTITHNTPTPNQHYVEKVEIWVNDDLTITKEYSSQATVSQFTYTYDITANDTDLIKVTATCNIGGDITDEVTAVDPTLKEFDLEISPKISTINEETNQTFEVNVTYDNQHLEDVTLVVTSEEGSIIWPVQIPDEPYKFIYTAPKVSTDTNEVINITASKTGYKTEYQELLFTIKDVGGVPKSDIDLELVPEISTIEENGYHALKLYVNSSGQPLDDGIIDISEDFGWVSEIEEVSTGYYEFNYYAPEVDIDTIETLSITVTKAGHNDGFIQMKFTIQNIEPPTSPDPRQTMDGIISSAEYDHEAELNGDDFIMHWKVSGSKIKIALDSKTTGWVAIGFDPEYKMKNADMIFGWVDDDNNVEVRDTYSIDDLGPHPEDKIDNILSFGGMESDGRTVIEFERSLTTNDSSRDKDIPEDGELTIIWAIGADDDFYSEHTSRGHGKINIATGEFTEGFELWPVHAIFMVLGLSLIILGNCIARALRKKNWWLRVHKTLTGIGSFCAVIGIIISIYMVETAGSGHIRYPHSILGIITIILLIKTPIIGLLILSSKSRPKKSIKNLRTYHRWIGRIATMLMFITVISGLILKGII